MKPSPDAPRGELFKAEKFKSTVLNDERSIQIYTPPGYNANGKPYPLLIFLDGETALLLFPLQVILDNLTASGKFPLIALTIASGNMRMRDMVFSTNFMEPFSRKPASPILRRLFSRSAQGKPCQHDDGDVLPGSTVELPVLPSGFQGARARLRRHTWQFSPSLSSRPLTARGGRVLRRG